MQSFTVEPIFTGVVAAIVQSFYAFRVYAVSNRRRILPALILALSAVQLGWAVGASAEIFRLNSQFDQFATWTYGVLTWLSAAAAADILITGSRESFLIHFPSLCPHFGFTFVATRPFSTVEG